MNIDILDMTAGDIAHAVGSRALKAVDVAQRILARIDETNPAVNAICTLSPDVLAQADACDRRLATGAPARLLEGVPVVIKDVIETRGLRTTFGSRLREQFVPPEDAAAVERLRAAGAIIVGKTNTPEFATDSNTWNTLFGMTRNPWNLNATPGGSSGGTAAALAAAMAPIGLGTDLGGSARTPASYCGIVGMRPATGRIPVYPNDYAWDLFVPHVVGPMARTVADVGRMLAALAGPDDRDPRSLPPPEHDYVAAGRGRSGIERARIAFTPDLGGLVVVDPEVARVVREACMRFTEQDCAVSDTCFNTAGVRQIISGTRAFAMVARYSEHLSRQPDLMSPKLVRQVTDAGTVPVVDVARAERMRTSYWRGVQRFFEVYDFLVMPTKSVTAFRLDEPTPEYIGDTKVEQYFDALIGTYAISITELPAITVPCGCDRNGLPIGMQIVGRRLREDRVLEAAAAYARLCPEHFARPPAIDASSVRPIYDPAKLPSLRI